MTASPIEHYRVPSIPSREILADRYCEIRNLSLELVEPLTAEDQQVQSMPDVSPTKWHLAHVTWFFETFLLKTYLSGYEEFHPTYNHLFNSYYEAVGPRHARPERGLLTRPVLQDILDYRAHVDAAMTELIAGSEEAALETLLPVFETGLNHEQQHQELMLMDIKHVFSCNPLAPVYRNRKPAVVRSLPEMEWLPVPGGRYRIGQDGTGFCFDNETPVHEILLGDFALSSRLVTNGEYLEFIDAGGYEKPEYWHMDGWATVRAEGWSSPLYWRDGNGGDWTEFTLAGLVPLQHDAPVCHVSFYEAAAYASWAGARLPTEQEWEAAAGHFGLGDVAGDGGNRLASRLFAPAPATPGSSGRPLQLTGDVWEWTESAYLPYPGFSAPQGAIGEYNGKFMVNQMVLRGASCATPPGHARITYRNFFYPHQRWAFSGFRLAS